LTSFKCGQAYANANFAYPSDKLYDLRTDYAPPMVEFCSAQEISAHNLSTSLSGRNEWMKLSPEGCGMAGGQSHF
jgi:hypothetical protein